MSRIVPAVMSAMLVSVAAIADEIPEAIAHYLFDEGTGETLLDRSGHNLRGTIIGAAWATESGKPVLRFDGHGDYVDFGDNRALKRAGDLTILAWVHLDASPYPDGMTNWTIVDCEEYRREGFILRIDGAASRLMYRVSQAGAEQAGFGKVTLDNHETYFLGLVQREGTATLFVDGVPDVQFGVKDPEFGAVPFKISSTDQSFAGAIFEVSIVGRALSNDEVASEYWRGAEAHGKDVSQRGQLKISPFIYEADGQAIAEVDFFGVLPLGEGETARVALARRDGAVLESTDVLAIPENGKRDFLFSLAAVEKGDYELRATVDGPARAIQAAAPFRYPAEAPAAPSPRAVPIEPIPASPPPLPYGVGVTEGGAMLITIRGQTFSVESRFSFPHGGYNAFACSDPTEGEGEAGWHVAHDHPTASTWEVDAAGAYYRISRRVRTESGRIVVSDTISNLSPDPVGIIIRHRLATGGSRFPRAFLAGGEATSPVSDCALKTCPTILASDTHLGLALVPLDDVFIVQSRGAFDGEGIELASNEFALDAGASYTLEWAVYVNATGDYYDLINAVRRDEGRNGVTVEGALSCLPETQRRRDASLVPGPEYFAARSVRYATVSCLSWCADDPTISIEGIEFVEYPKERALIRAMMTALAERQPEVYGMFHVAQQLYATNRPNALFPDSRVIDADGNHAVYPYDYAAGTYFSPERYGDNWRWWIYYPTLDNSFGKALLESVDVMMDDLGCRGVFVDGFSWGYGGEYTYDRWDGHTAEIDADTKTIVRKKGSVILLTQDAMLAYCRKVWAKNGVVIANNFTPTRTMSALPLIVDKEISEGPYVHLAPTPIAMGNPGAIRSEQDVYRDVLCKLRAGNLYFYYGEPATLTYESVPKRMYPITVQEIHAGYIKGAERLITLHSGVYGWQASRDLHLAYRYDARGHAVPAGFVTAVDATSVRTRIDLGEDETAILVRIPVTVRCAAPIHVIVESYDERGVQMSLNGEGTVEAIAPDGSCHTFELHGQRRITVPPAT